MHWPNLDGCAPRDEVKFVIRDRADFDYACDVVRPLRSDRRGRRAVLFSPVHGVLRARELARVDPRERRCRSRLQLQAHKYIWAPEARGV